MYHPLSGIQLYLYYTVRRAEIKRENHILTYLPLNQVNLGIDKKGTELYTKVLNLRRRLTMAAVSIGTMYGCAVCGTIVEIKKSGNGILTCCNEEMQIISGEEELKQVEAEEKVEEPYGGF